MCMLIFLPACCQYIYTLHTNGRFANKYFIDQSSYYFYISIKWLINAVFPLYFSQSYFTKLYLTIIQVKYPAAVAKCACKWRTFYSFIRLSLKINFFPAERWTFMNLILLKVTDTSPFDFLYLQQQLHNTDISLRTVSLTASWISYPRCTRHQVPARPFPPLSASYSS